MLRRIASSFVVAAALAAALGPPPADAQSIWIPRDRDLSVTLEAAKPNLEDVNEATFSPAMTLTARIPVASRLWLVGEAPYARIGADNNGGSSYDSYTPDEGGTIGTRISVSNSIPRDPSSGSSASVRRSPPRSRRPATRGLSGPCRT